MSRFRHLIQRFTPWLVLVSIYLALGLIGRVVLWAKFGVAADVGATHLPFLIGGGLVNDFVQSLYLFAPFALYILLVPDRWFRSTANRVILYVGMAATITGLLYLTAAEYFFFEEFDARFNIVAYDYLAYPTEVFTDIWDAYPVMKVLGVAVTLAALAVYLLRDSVIQGCAPVVRFRERLVAFAPYAFALALAIVFYPTNALSLSSNRVENELVQNGHSSFFRAARTSDIDYEAYYLSHEPAKNLSLLQEQLAADGAAFTQIDLGKMNRRHEARADGFGKLNVVVVSSESFGAEFSKLHGSQKDWTPNFDAYAKQGLWFANTYASGTRTVRGLEAITASFPPIPTVSILRRPGNQGIGTWGQVMNRLGYQSSFLYGGYGYFDDMNTFFEGNGFQVLDRTDIDHVRFENVWGVADEDLFDRAIQHYGEQYKAGKPFFSIIMTTSNHKPFTFRTGLEQYGIKPEGGGRQSGVRYADYALGYFLREAAKQPWFNDTLFVVVADHGARVYGKAEIPLETYEIPLMIYAPKHIAPRQIDTLMTQIDIAPTVLGLLGLPYEAPFFGIDALHEPADHTRIALFSHNHDIAILRDNELEVLGLGKTHEAFTYDPVLKTFKARADDPALRALGIAYFQTAADLFKSGRYN
ncbi:MAG: LTA synthase family protein [Gammaproteobacteria bacterium]|nr:LTA synthase family protein [Gammaproteobacteria bacterium]